MEDLRLLLREILENIEANGDIGTKWVEKRLTVRLNDPEFTDGA